MTADKFRVASLPSATAGVVFVRPTTTVKEASSLMLLHDYSQLPVMTTVRTVKGVFSWKSLGSAARLGGNPSLVQDCMDANAHIVSLRDSIVAAVRRIIEAEFVLVSDDSGAICGICTVFDVGQLFLAHSEPFIEVEQIELALRKLIAESLTDTDLRELGQTARSTGEVSGVGDLTFGGYLAWLEKDKNWAKLRLDIDRKSFIDRLKVINRIRNDLMHFRTEGIREKDVGELRKASKFFRLARKLGSA